MFECHVKSFIPPWFLFLVLFVCFLRWFFFLPPGKVNNLIKVDASSGFAGRQLSALQGVCEEVSFGAIGLQSDAE